MTKDRFLLNKVTNHDRICANLLVLEIGCLKIPGARSGSIDAGAQKVSAMYSA